MIFLIKYKLRVFLILLISSCAGFTDFDNLDYLLRNTFSSEFKRTEKFFDDFPYSYALVRLNRNNEVLMVLESVEDSKYVWVSNDGIRLVIYKGILIETVGLENDLKINNISGLEPKNEMEYVFNSNVTFTDPVLINSPVRLNINHDKKYMEVQKDYVDIKRRDKDSVSFVNEKSYLIESADYRLAPGSGKIKARFYYKF